MSAVRNNDMPFGAVRRSMITALDILPFVLGALFVFALVWDTYQEHVRKVYFQTILNGDVRANASSRVFHVPTCPQYNAISPAHLKTFKTVGEAEMAGYRPAMNCLTAIQDRSFGSDEEINASIAYEDSSD